MSEHDVCGKCGKASRLVDTNVGRRCKECAKRTTWPRGVCPACKQDRAITPQGGRWIWHVDNDPAQWDTPQGPSECPMSDQPAVDRDRFGSA